MGSASPYKDAPRIGEEGKAIDLRTIVTGDWLEIEIGPGRGMFLLERAAAEPKAAIIGLEIRRKWAAIVDARLGKLGLHSRARCFAEDAKYTLPFLGPDGSVKRFFVHFPDPWWKKRHHKRLVVGDLLVREMARLLCSGGELFVQTDVQERADSYRKQIELLDCFSPAPVREWGARTNREKRAIADGLPVHRMLWTRR